MKYILDSNIISFLLKGNRKIYEAIDDILDNLDNEIKIPMIAYYEIRRGLLKKGASKQIDLFTEYCRYFGFADITLSVMELSAKIYEYLRQNNCLIEDSDIFIGATALASDAILITDNVRHMERIPNLQILHLDK